MTSKVLVKLPVVPFSQRKKPPPEIIQLSSGGSSSGNSAGGGGGSSKSEDDSGEEDATIQPGQHQGDRVTQLEQNVKFLQDQHQVTLVSLHQEVEVLRQRNRDLQFQLVFSKGNYSSPSSPEDNANGSYTKTKQSGSPANVNMAPLQVELLEKELQDLKVSLSESKARSIYSAEVIEKQKQKLEFFEKSREKQKDIGIQVDCLLECQQVELRARLDDAEALVRRLRLENEEQRKEITSLKSATSFAHAGSNGHNNGNNHSGGGGGGSGNGNNRTGGGSARSNNRHGSSSSSSQNSYHSNSRGSGGNNDSGHQQQQQQQQQQQSQDDSYHKFPPLQTQSYWHRQNRQSHGYDHSSQGDYHRNNRHNNHQQQQQPQHPHQQSQRSDQENDLDGTVLPQLQNGNLRVDNSSYPPFFRPRNNHHNNAANNGNYYKEERNSGGGGGGNRKYRGHQKSQRDRQQQQQRDQDSREYHPRSQQQHHHQQQREYCDSAKSGRNSQQRQ